MLHAILEQATLPYVDLSYPEKSNYRFVPAAKRGSQLKAPIYQLGKDFESCCQDLGSFIELCPYFRIYIY